MTNLDRDKQNFIKRKEDRNLQQHREAYVSLQLFHRAVQERKLNSMVLEKARKALLRTQTTTMAG